MTTQTRIGELLLQNGLITEDQLHTALSSQVVNGGRLGSNMVELGFTGIDAVAELLSFQLGVPSAAPGLLGAIEPRVLKAIPPEVCDRYKVLPFDLEGRTLHVAMQDPRRQDIVDFLAAGLRATIEPYVVPQLRLLYYLERYHQIQRPKRFLRQQREGQASDHDSQRSYLAPTVVPGATVGPEPKREPGPTTSEFQLVYLDEVPREPVVEAAEAEAGFDISVEQPTPESNIELTSLQEALQQIDEAPTRDNLLRALVQPIFPGTSLVLLLLPRGELAVALAASGTELSQEQVRALVVPINKSKGLQQVMNERQPVRCASSDDAIHGMVATYLRAPAPQACCTVPVIVGSRVVNLLCIQRDRPFSDEDQASLVQLAERGAQAYERLIRTSHS